MFTLKLLQFLLCLDALISKEVLDSSESFSKLSTLHLKVCLFSKLLCSGELSYVTCLYLWMMNWSETLKEVNMIESITASYSIVSMCPPRDVIVWENWVEMHQQPVILAQILVISNKAN